MKVYLFSLETGLYLGEDFAEDCFAIRCRLPLPPGCTTIAPPPFGPGEVPVFVTADDRWELRRLTLAEVKASCARGPFGVTLREAPPRPDADDG